MKKFNISIKETLVKTVSVEANSEEEAEAKVTEMYKKGDIILGADDFTGYTELCFCDEDRCPDTEWFSMD